MPKMQKITNNITTFYSLYIMNRVNPFKTHVLYTKPQFFFLINITKKTKTIEKA